MIVKSVRTRFAPSPTGELHIGGARTALLNWLWARNREGAFVLRIEDTDQSRSSALYERNIMEDLRWLGLDWDEGPDVGGAYSPYRQSERLSIYQEIAKRLESFERAYPCYCTKEELEAERSRQISAGKPPRYSERCRHLTKAERLNMEKEGRRPSLRFATPRGRRLDFEDAIHGRRVYDLDDLSDFIIMRPDGWPTYIFAAAVDDHLMNITHIIRGDEHLDNAARQILIYDALEWERPIFAHIPTILDAEKRKLSKRFGAVSIAYYRSLGYLPEALVAYLATLSWSIEGSDAVPTLYDLAKRFSLDQISSSPPIHDEERLRYWGKLAIKKADLAWLAERVIACAGGNFKPINEKAFLALIDDVRGDCATLVEITQKIAWLFQRPQKCEGAPPWVSELVHVMRDLREWNAEEIGETLKSFCREKGIKGKDFYHLLRTMLTGARDGSSVALVLWSLGRDEALLRLE